jgi:predicted PurR-regulated permease PerM
MLGSMPDERIVRFRPRTILTILAIVLSVFAILQLLWLSRQVLTWILIAVFLALALNPLVDWLQRHGIRRRGLAVGTTFGLVFGAIALVSATILPQLVSEVNDFATKGLPDLVEDVTAGRGKLGFLQEDYHLVDRVREALEEGGARRLLGLSGTAVAVTKGVITAVAAVITITVLTFFMLLEGPGWLDRFFALLPPESEKRWSPIGRDIYRTVGGFVAGALLIATIAGVSTGILLTALGVQYAFALALLVGLLDLIPLAGATIGAVVVTTVAFIDASWPVGVAVLVFFVLYQQFENHVLYPMIYSRTVQLSPLAILIAVLIGASLAGILGALAAIPVAGTLQVLLLDFLRRRKEPIASAEVPEPI